MSIFIDTGDIKEIQKYHKMGVIRGVTTNPSILLKCGVVGGMDGIKKRALEIAKLIDPLPLSLEVTSNDYQEMIDQALDYFEWAPNVNVKITIHGPNGELDNLAVIHELTNKHGVKINATAMMSAQQCFMAAMAGASYVSLFGGRVNNMGYNSCAEIEKLRVVLDRHKLDAKIIIGSTREILNVIEWLGAGADFITVTPHLIGGMIVHPYSKETVKMFLDDAAKLEQSLEGATVL